MDQGKAAPFAGYLLPEAKIKELRDTAIDLDTCNKHIVNFAAIEGDYDKRVNLLQNQNNQLADRLNKSETSFLEKAGFFLFGAALTGLISYGIYRSR